MSAEAVRAAEYINARLFAAHRGAILWLPGVIAVFGNEGYLSGTDEPRQVNLRSRQVTDALCQVSPDLVLPQV